jgi:hypothetical protein
MSTLNPISTLHLHLIKYSLEEKKQQQTTKKEKLSRI